jgi:nodulation protein E
MTRRVVVTGVGCVSSLGVGAPALWDGLMLGQSAIALTRFARGGLEAQFPAAPVRGYAELDHFQPDELAMRDPFAQYAIVAAREAMRDAGVDSAYPDPAETGVILGNGSGGDGTREDAAIRLFGEKRLRCNPMLVPRTNSQASVGFVSMEFNATGPSLLISTGCAAATHAVAQAYLMIRHGLARRVISGGSEASLRLSVLQAFDAARVLSHTTCRPFSRDRDGMVISEGGGVVILEDLETARKRGAPIYAEIAGVGMSADAHSSVHPSEAGPVQALRGALKTGQVDPEEVAYINAHGTGTQVNDRVETRAIKTVFGEHARKLVVSSTKALHGHAFGAAGGIELVATLLAMRHGVAPPTANYLGPDEECDLDYVPNSARPMKIGVAVKQSFAFGGLNAAVILRRDIML